MATDTMDIDMDIDFDVVHDDELVRLQAEAAQLSALPSTLLPDADIDATNALEGAEEGEVAAHEIAQGKVHIIGVNELTTSDITNFASDNFRMDDFDRVQWIDDSSANLVYRSHDAALAALKAFSNEPAEPSLDERRAKPLLTHPQVELFVRLARVTDVKEEGAAERSRFYLLNPKHDPQSRFGSWGHDSVRRGERGARGIFRDDRARRRPTEEQGFNENLYDDEPESRAKFAAGGTKLRFEEDLITRTSKRPGWRHEDIFGKKDDGRLRNRSASPLRDGDGRYGFDDDQPYRQTARYRSPPPRPRQRSVEENRDLLQKHRADLFPGKKKSTVLANGLSNGSASVKQDLFPKFSSSQQNKDLFPEKLSHRRQEAKDLDPDEVANAIGRRPEKARERKGSDKPRDLFDRVEIGSVSGRLNHNAISAQASSAGFSFKGAASTPSFSIKGASQESIRVRELFPSKPGRDLIVGHSANRIGERQGGRLKENMQ